MDHHLVWQAWHLWHSAGSGGALGSQLTPWAAQLLTWQAWRLATSTVTLRGRRGTWQHGRSLCMAGMALGDMDRHFAWQAWPLWHWAGSGGALGSQLAPWSPQLFAWQAWRLATSTFTLRGRRGTWWHPRCKWIISLKYDFVTHTHNFVTHNLSHTSLPHATSPSHLCHAQFCHTHTQLCRAQLFHTQLCHKQLCHTQLCHTQLFHTHNFVTDKFVTHNSFTHNFVTNNLSQLPFHTRTTFCHVQLFVIYNLSHTSLSQTTLSHTHNFVTGNLSHNPSHTTVKIIDPPPSPLSFLLFPCCFSHFFWLLDEIDLWDYPAL